jgi:hypothetical protein
MPIVSAFIYLLAIHTLSAAEATTGNPLVINGQSNLWVQNQKISNPNGPCISITGAKNIQIINSEIGPCAGDGVNVIGSSGIKLTALSIHDSQGNGVAVATSANVNLNASQIQGGTSSVYVYLSTGVKITKNSFLNVQGPRPRGNFVQFNAVSGAGNRISCNTAVDLPGLSSPEDQINLYASNGLATDPIQVVGNKIYGGGPSTSGGGIILGDGSGSYQTAQDNVLVNPGQYGVSIAGGNHMQLINNKVFSQYFSYNNIGLYVWNQYTPVCSNITVQGNSVNYVGKNNTPGASAWDGGNCGTITGWSNNTFYDTTLTEDIFRSYEPVECL